jgi:hypothetical protein
VVKNNNPHYSSVDHFRAFVELRELRTRTRGACVSYAVLIEGGAPFPSYFFGFR